MHRLTAATLLAAGLLAAPAYADDDRCGNVASADWMSVEAITEKSKALGYEVREVERDDGCYKIKARDKDGRSVDVHMHPVTAAVVHTDDDDDD